MKKSIFITACVFIFLITAISCEIPQSITIKGSPGVHLPMGSPFESMETRLEDYLNSDKIKEMMGGDNIKIYEYTGSDVEDGVEAYIILYPIMEMELEFQDYITKRTQADDTNFTANIPPFPGESFPANGYHITKDSNGAVTPQQVTNENSDGVEPLFYVELADMAKSVKEVTGNAFGLELDDTSFQGKLKVKIPALGINNYISGQDVSGKLRFVTNSPATIHPKQNFVDDKISIYVIATEPCSGLLAPALVFDWTSAVIDTSDDSINDTYPIDNRDLKDFLGDSISFKEARGYIYAGGIGENTTMLLQEATTSNNLVENKSLTEKPHPSFSDRFNMPIPQHSLVDPIDLTGILNASTTSEQKLEYTITMPERTIYKGNTGKDDIIFADLVILLPLEFTTNAQPDSPQYAADYKKLDIKDLFPNMGNEDLFQRKGDDNDQFKNLKTVRFVLSKLQNDILGGKIYISVSAGNMTELLDLTENNPSAEFDISELPLPFIPSFEILIKKETDGSDSGKALFWLKRKNPGENPTFDFSLSVQAITDIEQTISF